MKNRVIEEDGDKEPVIFLGPEKIDAKPDWNIKTLHRRMEDKIERDVQGYIGYVPKGDEVTH